MPVVSTNTAANSALRFLNFNSSMAQNSVSKLASGSRIVKASDDAAGLAIGTKLKGDVTVLTQAGINAAGGASVLQVEDGGLARISDVLQRMKSLAAQSLSGVPTDAERAFINAEYTELIAEIDGIASTTTFNGQALLDGTGTAAVDFFVGTAVGDNIQVDLNFDATTATILGTSAGVDTAANAATAMAEVDAAIVTISTQRATVGGQISRFEFRGQQIATSLENIDAAKSSIMDVDLAAEQSKLVSNQVLVQAAVSAVSQANQIPQSLLRVLQ